jgi:hypothetical protein
LKPRTLLRVHEARKKRKNRRLFSSGGHRRPGPKGPSKELIDAIVEFKRRNPRVGCPRIAQEIAHALGIDIDKDIVRRVQFRIYYNENRVHQSLSGSSPGSRRRPPVRGARASPASVLKGLERPHKPVETCRTIVSQMTNIRKVTVFGGTGFVGTDPSSPTSALTNSNVDEVLEKTCALCSGAWPSTFLTMASR